MNLHRIIPLLFLFITGNLFSQAQSIIKDSLKIQGHQRHFTMYLPEGIPQGAPLVFVLHGYGGNGNINTWMNAAADRHKFALCVPVGLKDPQGKRSWNVGYPFQEGWEIDDVKTMCTMAKYVQKKYRLSKENTFLTGMSNGGEMCYLLAYSKQNTFKALGSLAGLTMEWMYSELDIDRPIPFLEIHGTQDHTSEWWGDLTNQGGWGAYMPVPLAVGTIIAKNRCTHIATDTIKGGVYSAKAHEIIRHRYANPQTNNDVWLYEVVNAGHNWFTDDMDTGEEVWNFFKRYLE